MTQRIELRKHGPFDLRYPVMELTPAPPSLWHLGEDRLDWYGFLAQFFPRSRRHASHALAAYESYRDSWSGLPETIAPVRRSVRLATPVVQAQGSSKARRGERQAGRRQFAAPSSALLTWEWEGGAVRAGKRSR
jgi:hypothetical protein